MQATAQDLNAEVVYGNTLQSFYAIDAARQAGLPSVWNPRESEPWRSYFSGFGGEIAARAITCFGYAYRVVFVSNVTRRLYAPLDTHHNFITIHNGLDRQRFNASLSKWPREEARKQLGLNGDTIMLLLLGTICPRKGQIDLVQRNVIDERGFSNGYRFH